MTEAATLRSLPGVSRVSEEKIPMLLQGIPGLLLGPAFVYYPGVFRDLIAALSSKFGVPGTGDVFSTADAVRDAGVAETSLRFFLRDFMNAQSPSPQLSLLAKVSWKAVLSFSMDNAFELKMQQEADRRPGRQSFMSLTQLTQPPMPRTVPGYKMLGSLVRDDFTLLSTDYLKRRKEWRYALKTFIDRVKGSPVLCLGMSEQPQVLLDLLAEMAEPALSPSALLFLADDPLAGNRRITELLQPRAKHLLVDATAGVFVRHVEEAEESAFTSFLPYGREQLTPFGELTQFADFAAVVNEHLKTPIGLGELNRLHDLLFSPSLTRWDPYVHNLDFKRSVTTRIQAAVARAIGIPHEEASAVVVTGTSASGKTSLLKRLAFDLATSGELVLWLKPWSFPDVTSLLGDLFKAIGRIKNFAGRRIVAVMDDPVAFPIGAVRDFTTAARIAGVEFVLVTAVRTSDWVTRDERESLIGSLPVADEVELPDRLDDEEFSALPAYLKLLGIASSDEDAAKQVSGVSSGRSADTLSMLYFLLPATRSSISSSVREEYLRLGDFAQLSRVLIGSVTQTTEFIKVGYEMVAVADYYRAPLPIEVLVSALGAEQGVTYASWLEAVHQGGPAWGLLYSEYAREGDTTCYRPRNSIITRLLVETINGGSFGHAGEMIVLSKLLRACNGSQSMYQRFCKQILVSNERLENLEYRDGLRLFDDAIAALPLKDKTLVHHKGLWIKNKGNDPIQAGKVFQEALETPVYPAQGRVERNEHIHTSMAAAIVQAVAQRRIDISMAKGSVLDHLNKARGSGFFSSHVVHVQANLMAELADVLGTEKGADQAADIYHLIGRALADVDRSLLLIRNMFSGRHQGAQATAMLEGVREKVLLRAGSIEDLKKDAERVWDKHGRQDGFTLAGRKLYQVAVNQNKGSAFLAALTYCDEATARVRLAGAEPITSLLETSVHIIYKWRIASARESFNDPIEWPRIRDYTGVILRSPESKDDPFYKYLHALSMCHLGRWTDAALLFQQLRQSGLPHEIIHAPRDLLLNTTGGIRRVQGEIRKGGAQSFLYVEALQHDFHLGGRDWPKDGAPAYAYIQFSFAGPLAILKV